MTERFYGGRRQPRIAMRGEKMAAAAERERPGGKNS